MADAWQSKNGRCLAEQAEQVALLLKKSFGLFGACHSYTMPSMSRTMI